MEHPSNPGPYFGLKVGYRAYQCIVCGTANSIATNHTDVCMARCVECSWKGHYSEEHGHYSAGSNRPHRYVGGPPQPDEVNPHVTDPRQPQFGIDEETFDFLVQTIIEADGESFPRSEERRIT